LNVKTEKTAAGFSGPRGSSFEPALEGQVQLPERKLRGTQRSRPFRPEERHRDGRRRMAGGKNGRLGSLGRLDHRHALHLPHPAAIGLTGTGQAREESSQEKQQFQTASL
jgi:hypothetical protein